MVNNPSFKLPDDFITKIVLSFASPSIIIVVMLINYYLLRNLYPWLSFLILALIIIIIARACILQTRWVWRLFGWGIILAISIVLLTSIFPISIVINY
jgi:hypothetical protein